MSRRQGIAAGGRFMKVDAKRVYGVVAVVAKAGHAVHVRLQAEGGGPHERLISVIPRLADHDR